MRPTILTTLIAAASWPVRVAAGGDDRRTCTVEGGGNNATDDAPAIAKAFRDCGQHGRVVLKPKTYYVNSVLNISGLHDVHVDWWGTVVWSTDITYWLNHSLPVGYQNQSTALVIGGDDVHIDGHGSGTLDGNGDYWYEWISEQPNTSNYPGRPHALTLNGLNNSAVRGLSFLRSQMWTLSMIYCHHVELDDIFVNNTGNRAQSSNTDGADTIRSSHIKFNNWTIYNGDDGISLKGNSTDIIVTNSRFYNGSGVALGSIGQYRGEFETMERLTAENLSFDNTMHAIYFKTWTADQNGYPPNGGGGGLGFASDMTFTNVTTKNLRGAAFAISQCTRFDGAPGDGNCTNSPFQIRDVSVHGLTGTTGSTRVASLQCSAVAPCEHIGLFDVNLQLANGTGPADEYLCGNAEHPDGFTCTGEPCVGGSAGGEC